MMPDFTLTDHGSILLLTPKTEAAKAWIEDNVSGERTYLGAALAVERRYIEALLEGIQAEGLSVWNVS